MELERNSELFISVYKNYWKYYRELEQDFTYIQRYVEFSESNFKTYSMEFLKLFQATCSEIDVIGKAMAKVVDSGFEETDGKNSILKLWYIIQDKYFWVDGPFTFMNKSANTKRYNINEYVCDFFGCYEVCPWNNYRVEECVTRNNIVRYDK